MTRIWDCWTFDLQGSLLGNVSKQAVLPAHLLSFVRNLNIALILGSDGSVRQQLSPSITWPVILYCTTVRQPRLISRLFAFDLLFTNIMSLCLIVLQTIAFLWISQTQPFELIHATFPFCIESAMTGHIWASL